MPSAHDDDETRHERLEALNLKLLAGAAVLTVALLLGVRFSGDAEPGRLAADLPPVDAVPDFASIHDVNEMKEEFFGFLLPLVEAQNDWVLDNRSFLLGVESRLEAGRAIRGREQTRLELLGARYRVMLSEPAALEDVRELLLRVDIIPPSLALAQAAAESGWGRSRFAREANNLFGEWCFTTGCGLVPQRRIPGAAHEVTLFDTVGDAVDSYFRNLNSHPAYEPLRELRATARDEHGRVLGTHLIDGLEMYSERRGEYLEELRHMIRINQLLRLDEPETVETAGL